jgi:succinate dehydrogenase/fumarate reductase flavoprotein subunit
LKKQNIDLNQDFLEISLCALNDHGGVKGNIWWESNVQHLFPVGGVAGNLGPGSVWGASINSALVGGIRSALFITTRYNGVPASEEEFLSVARTKINQKFQYAKKIIDPRSGNSNAVQQARKDIQERMAQAASLIREPAKVRQAVIDAWGLHYRLENEVKIPSVSGLPEIFLNLDLGLAHVIYLEALAEYLQSGGKSRGSFLVTDATGQSPCPGLPDQWKFSENPPDSMVDQKILEVYMDSHLKINKQWGSLRGLPDDLSEYSEIVQNFLDGSHVF